MLGFESTTVALASSSVKREVTTQPTSSSPSHQGTVPLPRYCWEGRPLVIMKKRKALIEAATGKLHVWLICYRSYKRKFCFH